MTTTAHDIAALLIEEQHSAGRPIDKMQLQKLLYLVQGAHLEFWGEPAFPCPLQAYRRGPVQPGVEQTYRDAVAATGTIPRPLGGDPEQLGETVVDTVHTILRYFGSWSAVELEDYVKKDDNPWLRARDGLPPGVPSSNEIAISDIAQWFADHGVDPNGSQDEPWTFTPQERTMAAERLDEAKQWGAFTTELPEHVKQTALQALDRARPRHH